MDISLPLQASWRMRRNVVLAALLVLAIFSLWDIAWLGLDHPLLYPMLVTRALLQWLPVLVLLVETIREVSVRQFHRWLWWAWVMVGLGNAIISILPTFYSLAPLTAKGQFILMLYGFFLTQLPWRKKLAAGLIVTATQLGLAAWIGHPDWNSQLIYLGILVGVGTLSARQQDAMHHAIVEQTRRLRALSETDALTGIDNRYAFERRLDQLLADGKPLLLALIDIDNFKGFNDLAGHLEGDRCLQQLAYGLSEAMEGHLARYGGEELVAWMTPSGEGSAERLGQRLVDQARALRLPHPGGGFVSVSVGVTLARTEDDRRSLLLRADQALYQAKNGGRNGFVVA
ncbi:GGDEF domain-containing protein [Gallaecimonas kandeliae]|uniref:GGDEF domain-containing protein n=1 Tax=Gallaecimonas kandeliae TaxID=3029055 RepID=UPI002647CB20|nr:GGDEF domain-containing protein [Gallaecimonas kandeliae]WKE66446.1 GGDEF domain-containing protein [Gallaecimonas kandeliae]